MQPEPPVVWVTGAAGGIGAATVAALRSAGYRVEGTDLAPPGGATGEGVIWSKADVTSEQEVHSVVESLRLRQGRLDVVVHLAGRAGGGSLCEMTAEAWRSDIDVNLTSAFLVARAAYPLLRETRGSLVLMASTNALNGGSALSGPAYAVAKAGIVNLSRYLAKEWAPDGIRVNCVAPGPVDTPMLARLDSRTIDKLTSSSLLGRLTRAEEVAAVILHLCGPGGSALTGTLHNVSGGLEID